MFLKDMISKHISKEINISPKFIKRFDNNQNQEEGN